MSYDSDDEDFSHLGSRLKRGSGGYTVWLVPDSAEVAKIESIQKVIGLKTLQIYSDALDKEPGFVPDNKRYTKPAEYPQAGVLILPGSNCGNTSQAGVKRMAQGVVDAYKGGHIRVAFESTNAVGGGGGSVHVLINEKESDIAALEELRSALKSRLWGPADARKSIPTPYLPLLEVPLAQSHNVHRDEGIDPGLLAIRGNAETTASSFNGALPTLTLTKVLVLGAGEVPIAAKHICLLNRPSIIIIMHIAVLLATVAALASVACLPVEPRDPAPLNPQPLPPGILHRPQYGYHPVIAADELDPIPEIPSVGGHQPRPNWQGGAIKPPTGGPYAVHGGAKVAGRNADPDTEA
ncbi:uncharacterized protein LOC62_03G005133 [Vanrija pseudolonga]|uniref:Uncharacterized protein n=1 Tax=Vanrija pseudolonga TaxID=143232 RepID=A0AAF0Y7R8_9TREE|nr:hypothetical protein LOC62_03G005133 [Vanrija pseudolonga]